MKKTLGIILAVIMAFSSIVTAAPVPMVTVESSAEVQQETVVIEEPQAESESEFVEETAVLTADDSKFAPHSRYGVNVINFDFEPENMNPSVIKSGTYTSGGTEEEFKFLQEQVSLNDCGALNTSLGETLDTNVKMLLESARQSLYPVGSTSAVKGLILVTDETTGNTYAEFPVSGQWPNVELYANTERNSNKVKIIIAENGYFTLAGDFLIKKDSDGNAATTDSYCTWGKYGLIRTGTSYFETNHFGVYDGAVTSSDYGKWKTITKSVSREGVQTYKKNSVDVTGEVAGFYAPKYGFALSKQESYNFSVYLDNLKLYYKPFTADLTIDMNGNTVATPIAGLDDYSTETLVDISALEAKVIDHGDKIFLGFSFTPDGEKITQDFYLTKDTTIYALWKTYKKTYYSNDMNAITGITHYAGKNAAESKSNYKVVTEDDTTFIRYIYSADNKYNAIVDSTFEMNSTFSSKMPTGDVQALQFRIRISNLPNFMELFPKAIYADDGTTLLAPAATSTDIYTGTDKNKVNTSAVDLNIYFQTDAPKKDGTQMGLSENRKASFPLYDYSEGSARHETWVTYYLDVRKLKDDESIYYWEESEILKFLRFDFPNYIWDGTVIDVDYLHFIEREDIIVPECDIYFLNGKEKTYITTSLSDIDFRKNSVLCFDFDEDIGLTAQEFYDRLLSNGMSAGLFDAACVYDEQTYTYTLYEDVSLRGKTFNLGNFSKMYEHDGVLVKFDSKYDNLTLKYLTTKAFDDGENLVPNGSFDVPYYRPFHENIFTYEVKDGALYVTHTEGCSEWSSNVVDDIALKPNTNYYVSLDIEHVNVHAKDENGEELPYIFETSGGYASVSLYMPFADSFFNFTNTIASNEVNYIPSLSDANTANFSLSKNTYEKAGTPHTRILTVHDDAYYSEMPRYDSDKKMYYYGSHSAAIVEDLSKLCGVELATDRYFGHNLWTTYKVKMFTAPTITIQTAFSNGVNKGLTKENSKIYGASRLGYRIKEFVIKEMFDVNLKDENGDIIETRWAAKDVPIKLPVKTDENGNLCLWVDENGNRYNPEDEFILTEAKDIVLTMYPLSIEAPVNMQKTSLRVTGYTGIRFLAGISKELKEKTAEYGFIVTRKTLLDKAGLSENELTFENKDKVAFISKASYDSVTQEDFIYAMDEETVFFTGLMKGIPEHMLDDVVVVRPYSKINGKYLYGKAASDSIISVAKKLYNNGYKDSEDNDLTEETVAYLKHILAMYGQPYELDALFAYNAEEKYATHNFARENMVVEIVEDPHNPENHVYKLTPLKSTSSYQYFWLSNHVKNHTFKTGDVYELSADFKVVDEKLYDSDGKIVEYTATFDENGMMKVFNPKDNSRKDVAASRFIINSSTHFPTSANNNAPLGRLNFTNNTTVYEYTNNTADGFFGVLIDSYGYYHEDGTNENFRFSVYVDNIVIKKISEAE